MGKGGNFNERLFQKQALYIRQLEEHLAVYEEKDRAQELLIGKLDQALEILAEELKRCRAEAKKGEPQEG